MNVKPGDLARTVGHPETAHCIVSVGRALSYSACIDEAIAYPAWICTALCRLKDERGGEAGPGEEIWISDRCLRPLPPDSTGDEIARSELKPIEVPA